MLTRYFSDIDTDKNISEREWFGFAVENVPQIQLEEMRKRNVLIESSKTDETGRKRDILVFQFGDDKDKKPEDRALQTPRVFYRREVSTSPFVVAKLSR